MSLLGEGKPYLIAPFSDDQYVNAWDIFLWKSASNQIFGSLHLTISYIFTDSASKARHFLVPRLFDPNNGNNWEAAS